MRGIILAAGKGRRLEAVQQGKPKCLLEFGGKTLIQHQLLSLRGAGINTATIVVGYEKNQIIDHLRDFPMEITYVENDDFATTNTLYSLWLARDSFDGGFVYFNADILFDYRIVSLLVQSDDRSLFACDTQACGAEEVKVVVDGSRIIQIGKEIDPRECLGEFIGIARFASPDIDGFRTTLSECAADKRLWGCFFEHTVDLFCRKREINWVDISHLPAAEIDFPEDLERARHTILPLLKERDGSGHAKS